MSSRATALVVSETFLLVIAIVVAALTSSSDDWEPTAVVALLLALALASDWLAISHRGRRISGTLVALVLAGALLGPAPATAIAIAAVLFDQLRARHPLARLITNLAAFATFALVAGLVLAAADVAPESPAVPLLVFATFLATDFLILLMIGGHHALETRTPLADGFRKRFVPVLRWDTLSAVLCALVATFSERTGVATIALMLFVVLAFQYLLRELLRTRERAARLAGLQLGVLVSMIETLALRDRMTARHSAAVARYARAIAEALGWSAEEQEIVHTAGLLHDIGKFAFPDAILLADTHLTDEQWAQVKRHPGDGAAIVRQIDGYAPVAEIIHAHHERWDGRGYPRALRDEEIPHAARVIAVADTYDVITARDSYRKPISEPDAIAELRRSAGGQLDPDLVELFIGLLTARDLTFRHGDDADFDAEVGFERRVRAHAFPRTT